MQAAGGGSLTSVAGWSSIAELKEVTWVAFVKIAPRVLGAAGCLYDTGLAALADQLWPGVACAHALVSLLARASTVGASLIQLVGIVAAALPGRQHAACVSDAMERRQAQSHSIPTNCSPRHPQDRTARPVTQNVSRRLHVSVTEHALLHFTTC